MRSGIRLWSWNHTEESAIRSLHDQGPICITVAFWNLHSNYCSQVLQLERMNTKLLHLSRNKSAWAGSLFDMCRVKIASEHAPLTAEAIRAATDIQSQQGSTKRQAAGFTGSTGSPTRSGKRRKETPTVSACCLIKELIMSLKEKTYSRLLLSDQGAQHVFERKYLQ